MGVLRVKFSGLCGFVPSRPLSGRRRRTKIDNMTVLLPDLREPQRLSFEDPHGLRRGLLHPHFPILAVLSESIRDNDWREEAPEVIVKRNLNGSLVRQRLTLFDLAGQEVKIVTSRRNSNLIVDYRKPRSFTNPVGCERTLRWVPRVRDMLPGAEVVRKSAPVVSSILLEDGSLETSRIDAEVVVDRTYYGVWRFRRTNTQDLPSDVVQCVASEVSFERPSVTEVKVEATAGELVLKQNRNDEILAWISNGELYEFLGLKTNFDFSAPGSDLANRDVEALFDLSADPILYKNRPCPHFERDQPERPRGAGAGARRRPCSSLLFEAFEF